MKWETRYMRSEDSGDARPGGNLYRAKVVGGWLVTHEWAEGQGTTFIPDPTWSWDWSKDQP